MINLSQVSDTFHDDWILLQSQFSLPDGQLDSGVGVAVAAEVTLAVAAGTVAVAAAAVAFVVAVASSAGDELSCVV